MPIKGLTDRVTPKFPSLGKLRKGGPKPENSKQPGPDLDHFRFTSDRKEVEFAFQQLFPAPKGKPAPDVIESVYLPYKTLDENFSAWKEHWVAGGLKHRCDGETMNLWQDEQGKYHTGSKPCPGGCKEVGRLTMIIPALIKAGFVGYVTLETHSLHDIMSIQACLMAIAEARGNNQMGLQGIPLLLRRVPEKISTPGKDGRVRRIKSLVKIEPIATWKPLQLMMVEKMEALPEPAPLALDEPELRELPEPEQDQDAGAENDDADDFVEGKDEIIPDAEYTEEKADAGTTGAADDFVIGGSNPPPPSTEPHWSENQTEMRGFHAELKKIADASGLSIGWGLAKRDVWGVEHTNEIALSKSGAIEKFREYCQQQAEKLGVKKLA